MNARLLLHVLIAVLTWGLFGYYWWLVSQRRVTPETARSLQLLAALVGLVWLGTTLWIHHNRRVFQRRRERRQRRRRTAAPSEIDALGQPIDFKGARNPQRAAYLELRVDPRTGRKRITVFAHPPRSVEHLHVVRGGAA